MLFQSTPGVAGKVVGRLLNHVTMAAEKVAPAPFDRLSSCAPLALIAEAREEKLPSTWANVSGDVVPERRVTVTCVDTIYPWLTVIWAAVV